MTYIISYHKARVCYVGIYTIMCIRLDTHVNFDLSVVYIYIYIYIGIRYACAAAQRLHAVKPMTASVQCVTLELTARRPQLLIPQFITIIY